MSKNEPKNDRKDEEGKQKVNENESQSPRDLPELDTNCLFLVNFCQAGHFSKKMKFAGVERTSAQKVSQNLDQLDEPG